MLELGAGYGHFINQLVAKRTIALDAWGGFVDYLRPGIEARVCDVTDLSFIAPASVDFVFASNLFEHIARSNLLQLKLALTERGTVTSCSLIIVIRIANISMITLTNRFIAIGVCATFSRRKVIAWLNAGHAFCS